ncbi:MAG: helix-turn-helix domain-containing protein [Anaerotruncus colihominis]
MNRFREQRIKHGYKTQKELADVLFVNQTAVSQWERGATTPSNQLLIKLSELYGVTTDYLLGRDEKEPVPTPMSDDGFDKSRVMAAFVGGDQSLSPEEQDALWGVYEYAVSKRNSGQEEAGEKMTLQALRFRGRSRHRCGLVELHAVCKILCHI